MSKNKKDISQDITDTKAIFKVCSDFLNNTSHQTQLIILEHASEEMWKGLDNVHLVESWRNEKNNKHPNALIPEEWIS